MKHHYLRTTHDLQPSNLASFWRKVAHALARWHENVRTRRLLAQLDDRQLRDLAISQSDRLAELDKPFWR